MLRTRVGYCGGTKEKPSYHDLGDHTEAFSIDYDPAVLTYEELLGYFWNGHHCGRNNGSRQYIHAVFYRDEKQKELAEASRAVAADRAGIAVSKVATELIPVGQFTYAEGYHHKYYLTRYKELRSFLEETYPEAKSLADSTVATRLNAYLGSGMGRDWEKFLSEISSYRLPESMEASLRKTAEKQ